MQHTLLPQILVLLVGLAAASPQFRPVPSDEAPEPPPVISEDTTASEGDDGVPFPCNKKWTLHGGKAAMAMMPSCEKLGDAADRGPDPEAKWRTGNCFDDLDSFFSERCKLPKETCELLRSTPEDMCDRLPHGPDKALAECHGDADCRATTTCWAEMDRHWWGYCVRQTKAKLIGCVGWVAMKRNECMGMEEQAGILDVEGLEYDRR